MSSLTVLNDYLFEFTSFRAPAKRADIEESVWKDFGKTGVVCVLLTCADLQKLPRKTASSIICQWLEECR